MTTAFELSGGAALGAAQAGMLLALAEAGIAPDLVVGTSVGAVNGAWLAGAPQTRQACARSLTSGGPSTPMTCSPEIPSPGSSVSSAGAGTSFPTGVFVIWCRTTCASNNSRTLRSLCTSSSPTSSAAKTSASIPAVLPPVRIGDRYYIHGRGGVNNTPNSHAVDAGADTVWVLSTGYACALRVPPPSALAMVLHALTLTVNQRLAVDVARYEGAIDLRVVPPLCPIRTPPADFGASAELIGRAHEATSVWLRSSHPRLTHASLLRPHLAFGPFVVNERTPAAS
jgi:NTE family protein